MGYNRSAVQTLRAGEVVSVNPIKATARVKFEDLDDLISHNLQVVQRRSKGERDYWLPQIGEFVLCAFFGNGLEAGFIRGSLYTDKDPPPAQKQEKTRSELEDGTWVEYDKETHQMRLHVEGTLDIHATGDVNIKSDGKVWATGKGEGTTVNMNHPAAPENKAEG